MTHSTLLKTGSFIGGRWVNSEEIFEVTNPADNTNVASVGNATVADAESAVSAAKSAFSLWKRQSANHRAQLLMRWHDLMMENQEELAQLLTLEQGKPIAEARGEIAYGASFVQWFAEEAKRVYGDTIPAPSNDKRFVAIKQPVGVVSAITPWNFPNAMITRKAAAAMAAGCSFIVKPSELTPLSALALAELACRAGIPDGVFSVVVSKDAKAIGEVLTQSPDIAKFTFTGSTAVGKILLAQCAATIKRTSMELGGNAPFIVFDDADLQSAVKGAIASKFRNAGQTCVCANRFFVHEAIYDEFLSEFTKAAEALTIGNGKDESTKLGPMISSAAVEKTHHNVTQALNQGARLVLGGNPSKLGDCYYPATLLADVTNDMDIARTELFSPVAPIIKFSSESEVLAMANDTEYGLASYFYTNDYQRIWRLSENLEYGMVGVNDGMVSNVVAPFGGVKHSGMGREGSKYGIEEYLEVKHLCMGGIASQ